MGNCKSIYGFVVSFFVPYDIICHNRLYEEEPLCAKRIIKNRFRRPAAERKRGGNTDCMRRNRYEG